MARKYVWVFNGNENRFPSGVFSTKEEAEAWIVRNKLTGMLTEYPVDVGVYDWAVENGSFKPKHEKHQSAEFIANFSSAAQRHSHYGSE